MTLLKDAGGTAGETFASLSSLKADKASLPVNLATYCTGDGAAEDATGFQAALDALPTEGGRLTSPQGKKYRISTALTLNGKADVEIDMNGSWIENRLSSAPVLTITSCPRARIISPRFRLLAGAPTAFILFDGGTAGATHSQWSVVYEPVFWYHVNIPFDTVDGIVIQGDNYWIEIIRPKSRLLSGGITGLLRRGVSFLTASNACKVIGGSLNSCSVGAYIKGANATEINGTAFETVNAAETIGVQLDGTNISSENNGGTRILNLRLEAVDIGIDFAMLYQGPSFPGIFIGPMSNHMGEANEANLIRNPNNIPFQRHHENKLELGSGWASFDTQIRAQAADSQSAAGMPLLEFKQRPLSSPITSLTVDPGTGAMSGSGTLTVLSTAAQGVTPTFPATGLVRIDNEVFSYTGKTGTTLTGVTRALGGTVAAAHQIGSTVEAGLNQVVAVDTTGALIVRSSSATPPKPADDRAILHHRSFITQLISWDIASGSSTVQQVVGDGAGGLTVVTSAFRASFRPGADNTIDLGLIGTRWRSIYAGGQINTGFQKLTSDVDINWTPITSPQDTLHTGTLTADRAFNLLTSGVQTGSHARVSRSGAGAFNLNVKNGSGGATLKALATDQWGEFKYDGTNWVLFEAGART